METTSPAATQNKKPRRAPPKTNNPPPPTSSGSRHERLCKICQHPRREDIDDDILRWRSPQDIVYDFDLGDRSAVYRHARATKLFSQRKQNLNPALERVIESVYDAKPSMNAVLKAMAIYARINGNEAYKAGFADPPRHTIITHITVHPEEGGGHPTVAANGLVGAPLAAPSSNPSQAEPSGHGFHRADTNRPSVNPAAQGQSSSPADENVARSATQGSPEGAREDVAVVEPPASDFKPPDSRTAIDMVPVHFADGPAEVVLKKYPHFKRFGPFASILIPIVLLGWLLWSALLGAASPTVFASAVSSTRSTAASATNFPLFPLYPLPPQPSLFHSPWNPNGSCFSSPSFRSSPSPTSHFFYPPQNVQSKNANSLKTRPNLIFYSPQKRSFTRLRRRDASATTRRATDMAPMSSTVSTSAI